jgi:hypothetical protein
MNQIIKKYVICLIFSVDLFVLVWLSEILRNIVLAMSAGLNSGIFTLVLFSVEIFFLFVFGIVPLILLSMWLISPIPVRKLLVQFGLTEKLFDKKGKKNKDNSAPSHDEIRNSILTILYKKAESTPYDSEVNRDKLIEALKIADNIIDFNISYLKQEQLIQTREVPNAPWLLAKITSSGINVIEHKEENKNRYPFLNASILPIQIGLINF